MIPCLVELPDEIFIKIRQVAEDKKKTMSQLITEWLTQQMIMQPPIPQADPDILKFYGSLPEFPDRGSQGEYEPRERLE